ncbi:sensor protein kinase WalK [Thermoclostridium stercorarium subsp. stercorarium DSM 8532]|jgi:two-component system phosphate regulon sensor histidine kinase PhoR|uniref:histidine kinase n=2 Tax=Thermoclostridium stercorarium TaxID=1510 RepID=L7VRA1_THES1|nr:ATP-binding protein [Thermoclostridium stercorarium]AGC69184.1 sensor protein kinase WalK [Thermoclostridium stercorarium subsp. stercorarium DSM 8532]AGI40155.1 PAS domain-containing protein [Thermoclostridium stercorarium subsp. stercorarium DSM 8532]ANW99462.1 PAS domain-containing sensor histidine kinase [Thermoclostridium stercorarium subsp. thermolacticum DSM 2910]
MKKKIFKNMVVLSFAAVLITSFLICIVLYNYNFSTMKRQLRNMAFFLASSLNSEAVQISDFTELTRNVNNRVTVIAGDGTVLFDNMTDIRSLEKHLDRPEVKSALDTGTGETVRLSGTLGKQTYYYAVRLNNGLVLRLSFTTDTVYSTYFSILPYIVLISLFVIVLSMIMAVNQSKQIVAPINAINLDKPAESSVYDELSPLLLRIGYLRNHLDRQIAEAKEQQRQFETIINNMSEGLIILDRHGRVLTINPSAVKLLGGLAGDYNGKNILILNRSNDFQLIIEKAMGGTPSESIITKHERSIRIWANPVVKEGKVEGAIMILHDVTEAQMAENFRREFSANVSHELKSPLTVISGFAELIKNNMVKSDDIPVFAGRIHCEAKRLLKLIEDIIEISRLDEGINDLPLEEINLLEICANAAKSLSELAAKKEVSVTVKGDAVVIRGVYRLIEELVYNLVENAINYNKNSGRVIVTVEKTNSGAVLKVEDTGIGIPKEHHQRIFERFYRVDKSHSKETGGTGLGLSIVKHAAKYHNAVIDLQSDVGKGTTVAVTFPQ